MSQLQKSVLPHGHFLDEPDLPKGTTRFWLIRHAVVDASVRGMMYGAMDVPLCQQTIVSQKKGYVSLARRLPADALWFSSSLQRAKNTAAEIHRSGTFLNGKIITDSRFAEQSIGDWHGTPHDSFLSLLNLPPSPFWSLSATEVPPNGESMLDVCARVSRGLEQLATENSGRDSIIVSHGGAIRAALAHALCVHPETALRFTIQNLSLSIIERINGIWRVVVVNELPDFRDKSGG